MDAKGLLNIIIWGLALIFVGWPIAGFASWIYIFVLPFEVCCGCGLADMLRQVRLTAIVVVPKSCYDSSIHKLLDFSRMSRIYVS